MTIAEKIKTRREELGISQHRLAQMVNATPSAVARWESGITAPRTEYIPPLCAALKVSSVWMVGKNVAATHATAADAGECLLYDHTAPPMEKCWYADCARCGWHSQEHARREALLRERGLTRLDNGLRGLKIGAEKLKEIAG